MFDDGLASRNELSTAFMADKKAGMSKRAALEAVDTKDKEKEKEKDDEQVLEKHTSSKSPVIPFTSFSLIIAQSKDKRAQLAHCGSNLFRRAINFDLWCFIDEFLPKCPDVLLYDNTQRKSGGNVKATKGDKKLIIKDNKPVVLYSLLEDAMRNQKLRSIETILNAWVTLLTTSPVDMLSQIIFPFNALKKSELYYLASNYPKEFQDFIVRLKPLRSHEIILGDAFSFPLGDAKFHICGVNDRLPIINDELGKTIPFWVTEKTKKKIEDNDDDIIDQVVSGYFLPLKNATDSKLLLTYVDVCESLDGDKTLFGSSIVIMSVRFAWRAYGIFIFI